MSGIRIGLDVGTTIVKVAAYNDQGHLIARSDAANPVSRPHPGWSEQDMTEVWERTADCLSRLVDRLRAAGHETHDITSVGMCAQGDGLWMLDGNCQPVGPAMLWNDTRAGELIPDDMSGDRQRQIAEACHTANWPGTSGSLIEWIVRHEPQRADACRHIVTCVDWIGFMLTGVIAQDFANASIPFLDLKSRTWSQGVLAAFGIEEMSDRLPHLQSATNVLGQVTKEAALVTGLPDGLPVSTGTMDLSALLVGNGMREPGDTLISLGTTAVLAILTDSVPATDNVVGATALHPTANTLTRIFGPATGTGTFDWFTSLHPSTLSGANVDQVADKLNEIVSEVPPGANGVLFHPYLNGERAPFVAPDARGSFNGLTPSTTTAEMGRAVMEGVAFSLRHCFEAEGVRPKSTIRLTGGGSHNPVWCEILADVLGVEVSVSSAADHGLWGAACIGAAAVGHGDACDLANRDEESRLYRPAPSQHEAYSQIFGKYQAVADASREIWAALSAKGH
ncbi:MAG: FGGY family carbohydrate kinase [Pseudomonadota bacterium]